jgi:hypothetical protein
LGDGEKHFDKCLNTETLNPYTCLKYFSTLFTKEDKWLLEMEVQIIDLDHTDEFDNDLTMQEVEEVTSGMENNKATGFDSIPAEAWKMLATKDARPEILMEFFNMITNKENF